MLPRNIYSSIGSLEAKNDSPKHAMSLFLYINEEGLIVYSHLNDDQESKKAYEYQRTLIQNDIGLTYNQVDHLINQLKLDDFDREKD